MQQLPAFMDTSSHTGVLPAASCVASQRPHCWTQKLLWTPLLLRQFLIRVQMKEQKRWMSIRLPSKQKGAGGGNEEVLDLAFLLCSSERDILYLEEKKGLILQESPSIYDLRIIAVSRLMLANILDNISVYWVALGKKLAQVALSYGGSDLVGTAFSEEIFKAAGKPSGTSIQELVNLIKDLKAVPVQRDTFFNVIQQYS